MEFENVLVETDGPVATITLNRPEAPGRGALADLGESSIARDRENLRQLVDSWLWMWNYRKPIIAQTHNYCLSGGLDLIGACDIVFAAEGTRFGHPAARGLGIPPTLGLLPMKTGAAATKELLFTGDLVDARQARELGIVQHAVPAAGPAAEHDAANRPS